MLGAETLVCAETYRSGRIWKNLQGGEFMRVRMGKGQVVAFDAFIEKKVETMKNELGFYPALKEIGAKCTPPQPTDYIFRSLHRLAAAGRLSKEAMMVYNAKNNLKNIKEKENAHEQEKVSKAASKTRKSKTAK